MNWIKFFGSKKIFILVFLPSILFEIYLYLRFGSDMGEGINDLAFVQSLFLTLGSFLLLMGIYFKAHKNNKVSLFFFALFVALIILNFYFEFPGFFRDFFNL